MLENHKASRHPTIGVKRAKAHKVTVCPREKVKIWHQATMHGRSKVRIAATIDGAE
jgi:hypothetical protein